MYPAKKKSGVLLLRNKGRKAIVEQLINSAEKYPKEEYNSGPVKLSVEDKGLQSSQPPGTLSLLPFVLVLLGTQIWTNCEVLCNRMSFLIGLGSVPSSKPPSMDSCTS